VVLKSCGLIFNQITRVTQNHKKNPHPTFPSILFNSPCLLLQNAGGRGKKKGAQLTPTTTIIKSEGAQIFLNKVPLQLLPLPWRRGAGGKREWVKETGFLFSSASLQGVTKRLTFFEVMERKCYAHGLK
jgi:hypothetical protein